MLGRVAIIVTFALLGAAAWVLPPWALGRIEIHNPETTWPWLGDGLENAQLHVTLPLLFVIGVFYGVVDPPKYWIALVTVWWICPFDIAIDVFKHPTSHNLWPIGLVLFAMLCLPALAGGCLGSRLRQVIVGRFDHLS
jgi:hypothetical protein